MAALGAGAVMGALVMAELNQPWPSRPMVIVPALVLSIATIALGPSIGLRPPPDCSP